MILYVGRIRRVSYFSFLRCRVEFHHCSQFSSNIKFAFTNLRTLFGQKPNIKLCRFQLMLTGHLFFWKVLMCSDKNSTLSVFSINQLEFLGNDKETSQIPLSGSHLNQSIQGGHQLFIENRFSKSFREKNRIKIGF